MKTPAKKAPGREPAAKKASAAKAVPAAPSRTQAVQDVLARTIRGFTTEQVTERLEKAGVASTSRQTSAALSALKRRGAAARDDAGRWTLVS